MNVSLTPELDNFVSGKVESGRYNSASEVVREALRQAEDTAEIVVQLHPDDLTLLREHHSPLLAGLPEIGPLRFAHSAEVSRGGCILQTRFGIVDERRETKIEQLRNAILA